MTQLEVWYNLPMNVSQPCVAAKLVADQGSSGSFREEGKKVTTHPNMLKD